MGSARCLMEFCNISHAIHVWYMDLHLVENYGKCIGSYVIHGCYRLDHLSHVPWFWASQRYLAILAPERRVCIKIFVDLQVWICNNICRFNIFACAHVTVLFDIVLWLSVNQATWQVGVFCFWWVVWSRIWCLLCLKFFCFSKHDLQ